MISKTYQGLIAEGIYEGEESHKAIFLIENGLISEPLAEILWNEVGCYGKFLTVRYWISENKMSKEELIICDIANYYGKSDTDFRHRYSELTGYLGTTEKIKVGGHDLIEELRSNIGKFIYLEIDYHKSDQMIRFK